MSLLGRVADAGVGCEPSCSSHTASLWGRHQTNGACGGAFGRAAPRQLAAYRRQHTATALRGPCPLASSSNVGPVAGSSGGGASSSSTRCNAVVASAPATSLAGLRQEAYMQASLGPGLINPPTRVKAPGRIVAIGDLHGDLPKTIRSLEVAGVLGEVEGSPIWVGGDTTVVQLGDVLDRGDCEIGIVLLLRELDRQAREEDGAVYMLNGNHESLNIAGDYRYVTPGAFVESAAASGLRGEALQSWDNQLRARLRVYSPGGPMAMELAKNPSVLVVNDTVFAHGGLLPQHVKYGLERLNSEVAAWMRGDRAPDGTHAAPPFLAMGNSSSVMWNRTFGKEQWVNPYDRYHACSTLKQALEQAGVERMVVGHTPQMCGCNSECDGKVWRVDIGMSSGVLDAAPQVLFIDALPDGTTQMKVAADADAGREYTLGVRQ